MLPYKENIKAILECNFAGFKEELIDLAVDSIMDLTESNEKCENPISDFNFHRACLAQIIDRIDDSETFSCVEFYISEAMEIILKMRDCKYTDLRSGKT